jgi:hypothetical protein
MESNNAATGVALLFGVGSRVIVVVVMHRDKSSVCHCECTTRS